MIGVHRQGFNAFFLRNDVGVDVFHEVRPEDIEAQPEMFEVRRTREQLFPNGLPGEWVEV